MKKALISPQEPVYSYTGEYLGERVCETAQQEFPVARPLFWVDCEDSVEADRYYYSNGDILIIPEPEQIQPEVTGAIEL